MKKLRKPIVLPLVGEQGKRLAALSKDVDHKRAALAAAEQRVMDAIAMVVSARVDPVTVADWQIAVNDVSVVLTPPTQPEAAP
jgi:hypothetical protein